MEKLNADDRKFMELAVEEARKCPSRPPGGKPTPKVGAVVVQDGRILAAAHRGEPPYPEAHAEFIALEKKLKDTKIVGATVYTTLEPCTAGSRTPPKVPCVERLVERFVSRVVIGMIDPDHRVRGLSQRRLTEARIQIGYFPMDLIFELEELNREFVRSKKSQDPEGRSNRLESRGVPASDSITSRPAQSPETQDYAILSACWPALYAWHSAVANAVRLCGTQEEYFSPDHIGITVDTEPYAVPLPLAHARARLLENIIDGYPFDGPCVRLVDYHAAPRDSEERKYLRLTLGRMTWYDYILANQRFGDLDMTRLLNDDQKVTNFVDFDTLVRERAVSSSQLSNILTAYLTATTSDGFLVYSQRGRHVASHKNLRMSAVSENLHPQQDGVFGPHSAESLFLAAARGISEELSPTLVPRTPATDIYLLGLEFHLQGYHPGLLFYLPLAETRAEVERACRVAPGKDFLEGEMRFVHLDNFADLQMLLSQEDWFAAGKASIIRTLEFLESRARSGGASPAHVAGKMSQRHSHSGRLAS